MIAVIITMILSAMVAVVRLPTITIVAVIGGSESVVFAVMVMVSRGDRGRYGEREREVRCLAQRWR